jgi:cell filamentation protein
MQDPQSMPGNLCPLNLQGLPDYSLLQPIETAAAYQRGRELEIVGLTGKFDAAHLCSLHRYLFQDIFPWAGELRVVNMSKGSSQFGPALHIAGALVDALEKLRREDFLVKLTPEMFAQRAAFYLGEINAIHPFREGNGRAQREFIRQLGVHAGHRLSWAVEGTGFTQQGMIEASVLSHTQGDNSGLATIIEAALFSTRERAEGR